MNPTQNVTTLTDIELLERLATSNEDTVYDEFVNRYHSLIKNECLKKCKKRKLDKHIGTQIANDTFARVRKSRKSFNRDKLTSTNQKSAILGWLYRIQSNLFIDYHNSQKTNTEKVEFYLDDLSENVKIPIGRELSYKRDIAERIFSKLSPKQKEVVLKDIEYKRFQKYHKTEVLDELANDLGVKKSSIRKIRERAKIKIKDAIDEINGEK